MEEKKQNLKNFYNVYISLVMKYIPKSKQKEYFYTKKEMDEKLKNGKLKFIWVERKTIWKK